MKPLAGRSGSAFLALSTSAALLILSGLQAQGVSSSDSTQGTESSEIVTIAPASPTPSPTPGEEQPPLASIDPAPSLPSPPTFNVDEPASTPTDNETPASPQPADTAPAGLADGEQSNGTSTPGDSAHSPTLDPVAPPLPSPRAGSSFRAATGAPPSPFFANPNNPALTPAFVANAGEGRFLKEIIWLQWPSGNLIWEDKIANDPKKPKSLTLHNYLDVSPRVRLVTTCTINKLVYNNRKTNNAVNASGPIESYSPGRYGGDFLDNLYRATDPRGNLILKNFGIKNNDGDPASADGGRYGTPSFNLNCQAQVLTRQTENSGNYTTSTPFPIEGLVISDAESAHYNKDHQEFVRATTAQPAQWYMLDKIWNQNLCGPQGNTQAERNRSLNAIPTMDPNSRKIRANATFADWIGNTITILPNGSECVSPMGTPGATLFAQGISSARITLQGHGVQAVALGLVVPRDLGDAPRSYGEAIALYHPTWENPLSRGLTNLTRGAKLANARAPKYVLGDDVTHDAEEAYNDLADRDGFDDAITAQEAVMDAAPGRSTSKTIRCKGNGVVAGWVDWNLNGVFDSTEKSDSEVRCQGNKAMLTWNIPEDVIRAVNAEDFNPKQSIMRLRIVAPQESTLGGGSAMEPTGATLTGEVEDHGVQLFTPRLQLLNKVVDSPFVPQAQRLKYTDWKVRAEYQATPPNKNHVLESNGQFEKTAYAGTYVLSLEPPQTPSLAGYVNDGWSCVQTPGSQHPQGKSYNSSFVLDKNNKETGHLTIPQSDHVTCTIVQRAVPGTLTWVKVDPKNTPLARSEWNLVGPSSETGAPRQVTVVDCVEKPCDPKLHDTDERRGYLKVGNLVWGNYELTETRAPAGYVLDSTKKTVTVIGETNAGTIVNHMHEPLVIPLTGGTASIFYVLAGGGLTVVALAGAAAIGNRGRSRG